ncbi:MAG TPA: MBL fold metallo-hydrolase [Streptosporangiaceae bacterium]|jgi:glyoxylase-like metal-dependent hydrolase (beta-lactamase superfamily II)/rhodanese-related sulfurtransferase
MDVEVFVTPGLGDNSYLVVSGDEALVVDPQRDAWRFARTAQARGAAIRAVLETHVHNDYVSGGHELRAATGAQIIAPAKGRYEFPHRPVDEGDEVLLGDLRLAAMATPGHTFEHISWLAHDGDAPVAVFTGGSLLVGSAGRPDLLGDAYTDELARAQYETLVRLSALPDTVQVLPTHGAGSFCVAAMPTTQRTSTIAAERAENPLLSAAGYDDFHTELCSELMAYPAYYAHMAPLNRAGVPVLGGVPDVPAISARTLAEQRDRGAWVIDARDRDAFAKTHIPGSLNIELNSGFGSYVGWLLPFDAPLVLVLPEPYQASLTEAATQLLRIGWTQVRGHLEGGIDAWDGELRSYPTAGVEELCAAMQRGDDLLVLDVRQELEWNWGVIPGSRQIFVADLPSRLDTLPHDRPVWVICSNGHRAAIAAGLLDRAGIPVRLIGAAGVTEWRRHCEP